MDKTLKKLVLIALIILLTPTVSTSAGKEEARKTCNTISETAGIILEKRHAGDPMVEILAKAEGQEIYEKIIIEAYERVRYPYPDDEYYNELINDFKNDVFLECYKGYMGID